MARAHRPHLAVVDAIEQMLNGKVDVRALPLPDDLDAVRKRRQSTVRPTRAAILREVLVPHHGAIALVKATVEVAPIEAWQRRGPWHFQVRRRGAAVDGHLRGRGDDLRLAPGALRHWCLFDQLGRLRAAAFGCRRSLPRGLRELEQVAGLVSAPIRLQRISPRLRHRLAALALVAPAFPRRRRHRADEEQQHQGRQWCGNG
mmetsp:Transcript_50512/g.132837  ORF Transcript_50512/g.132837 Transcript_50512/m.132837 type:complete len:202 (+) Transcript_50512:798-1403(+)